MAFGRLGISPGSLMGHTKARRRWRGMFAIEFLGRLLWALSSLAAAIWVARQSWWFENDPMLLASTSPKVTLPGPFGKYFAATLLLCVAVGSLLFLVDIVRAAAILHLAAAIAVLFRDSLVLLNNLFFNSSSEGPAMPSTLAWNLAIKTWHLISVVAALLLFISYEKRLSIQRHTMDKII